MVLFQKIITLVSDLLWLSIYLGSIFRQKSAILDPNLRHYVIYMLFIPFKCKVLDKYWYFQKLEWISVILRLISKFEPLSNSCYQVFHFWLQNENSFELILMPAHFCEITLTFFGSLGNWLTRSIERTVGYILVFLKKACENAKIL